MQRHGGSYGQRSSGDQGGFGQGRGGNGDLRSDLERRLKDPERVLYFQPGSNSEQPAPRPELFGAEAEAVARKLAGVPASQLRRFFGGVIAIKRRLEIDGSLGSDFIKGEMALLKAKAAYALARLKYPGEAGELLSLFVRHGRSIEDRRTFTAFARHLEAVMAFHKVFEVKQGRD